MSIIKRVKKPVEPVSLRKAVVAGLIAAGIAAGVIRGCLLPYRAAMERNRAQMEEFEIKQRARDLEFNEGMDWIKQLEQRLLDEYLEGLERERAEKDSGGSKSKIKPGAGSTNSVPRIRGTPINPKLIQNVAFILRQDSAKKVFSASFSASTGVPSRSVLNLVSVLRRDCSRISVDARKQFFSDSVRRAALRNGLDPLLLQKVCQHESRWNPFAVCENDNGTYDFGLFQLNSATLADAYARGVKVNPFNVEESADFAAKHLAHLINVFGDSSLAVVAYNRGEGKVRKWLRRGLSTEEILNIVRNAAYHRSVLSQKV